MMAMVSDVEYGQKKQHIVFSHVNFLSHQTIVSSRQHNTGTGNLYVKIWQAGVCCSVHSIPVA